MLSDELLDDDRPGRACKPRSTRSSSKPGNTICGTSSRKSTSWVNRGRPRSTRRQPADQRIADRSGVERLGQRFDGPYRIVRQEVGVNVHGVR